MVRACDANPNYYRNENLIMNYKNSVLVKNELKNFIILSFLVYLLVALKNGRFYMGVEPMLYSAFLFLISILVNRPKNNSIGIWEGGNKYYSLLLIILVTELISTFSLQMPWDIESLFGSYFDKDAVFHLSIVESIKSNLYPSTMLHGSPYLPYHCGSHALLAFLSAFSNIPAVALLQFQVSFFPILFFSYFMLNSLNDANKFPFLVAILLFLAINKHEVFFYSFDISTPVGLFWGFLIFIRTSNGSANQSNSIFIDSILLFLSTYSKVSAGVYFFGIYALFVAFFSEFSSRGKLLRLTIIGFVFLFVFQLVTNEHSGGGIVLEPNSLYYQLLYQEKRDVFIPIFFILPVLLLLTSIILKDKQYAFYSFGILLFTILAINLNFQNRNHMHFIRSANFLSLFLIASLHFKGGIAKYNFVISPVVMRNICIFALISFFIFYNEPVRPGQTKETTVLYIDKLKSLKNSREKFLIEIPESEVKFWGHYPWGDHFSRYFMAFYIPMISGKEAYNGYNEKFMKNKNVAWYPVGSYGYSTYYNYELDLSNYKYVLRLEKVGNSIRELRIPIVQGKIQ